MALILNVSRRLQRRFLSDPMVLEVFSIVYPFSAAQFTILRDEREEGREGWIPSRGEEWGAVQNIQSQCCGGIVIVIIIILCYHSFDRCG
jgi:hypothetical protein